MTTGAEVAWLAGLLEGEGSFFMLTSHVGGKAYRYPRIAVNMTDRDIIERVAALLCGSVYDIPATSIRPGMKLQYRAQASGSNAAEWMVRLKPWLGARRAAKIDELLAEYGAIEPTNVRRARACSQSQKARWALHGSRSGKLI